MKNNAILKTIAFNIRAVRKCMGISQEELAEMANLHRTYIGQVERAEKNITILSLEKIAIALNLSVASLLKSGRL